MWQLERDDLLYTQLLIQFADEMWREGVKTRGFRTGRRWPVTASRIGLSERHEQGVDILDCLRLYGEVRVGPLEMVQLAHKVPLFVSQTMLRGLRHQVSASGRSLLALAVL